MWEVELGVFPAGGVVIRGVTMTIFGLSNYKKWICCHLRWGRQLEEKLKLNFDLTLPQAQ